ncbi:MAG: hypothetical protein QXZ31_07085 [Thermofilaceae archaeon]
MARERLVYLRVDREEAIRLPEAEEVLRAINSGRLYKFIRDIWYEGCGASGFLRCLLIRMGEKTYIVKEFEPLSRKELKKMLLIFEQQ